MCEYLRARACLFVCVCVCVYVCVCVGILGRVLLGAGLCRGQLIPFQLD
jgi:hypothetical protein